MWFFLCVFLIMLMYFLGQQLGRVFWMIIQYCYLLLICVFFMYIFFEQNKYFFVIMFMFFGLLQLYWLSFVSYSAGKNFVSVGKMFYNLCFTTIFKSSYSVYIFCLLFLFLFCINNDSNILSGVLWYN